MAARAPRRRTTQSGFSLIELMVALTVLLIGISGIIALQVTALRASSYSRHLTEASVVGEDKLEQLRTIPIDDLVNGTETVDEQGFPSPDGPYTRAWTVVWDGSGLVALVTVTVTWDERGSEEHSIVFATERAR